MKLYTEEQVIDILQSGSFPYNNEELNEILSELTPIELPSDEEIVDMSQEEPDDNLSPSEEFQRGAKWMKDKILSK